MFIELHYKENNDPVIVNIDKVDYITKQQRISKDSAIIMIGEYPLKTAESYEQVVEMIRAREK